MTAGTGIDTVAASVCPLDDLTPGSVRRVEAAGRAVAVTNVGGDLFAVDDACLHRGASLAGGRIVGALLECPSHWWRYDVRTGERVDSPGVCLTTYRVRIEDGVVVVDVPPAPPARSLREILLAHARGEDGPAA